MLDDALSLDRLKTDYDRDGFVVLPGAVPAATVARIKAAADELMAAAAERKPGDPHYDFEPELADGRPAVQRIKRPDAIHPVLDELMRAPELMELITTLIGPDVRLSNSKINVKMPRVGSPLEWHQDWAFIPHTNPDLAILAIAIDPCTADNGPMLMIPGSHRGPLFSHHHDGVFRGAIDVEAEGIDTAQAVAVTGPPGTISIHHPMTVHGSGHNVSDGPRRVLFYEYAAADAWPLFYGVEWDDYEKRMVHGRSTDAPRQVPMPIRMPYPRSTKGMIYDIQRDLAHRYFEPASAPRP